MSDIQAAVMGATTTIKTLADGTFRLSVDVEPRFAQQAFALFGSPGTPVALARITNEAAVEQDRKAQREPDKKGGALAKLAGMLCADPEFWKFLAHEFASTCNSADDAADLVRQTCDIGSRADLDNDAVAAKNFHEKIRGPWLKWRSARGLK
jgi:hypothetical protein